MKQLLLDTHVLLWWLADSRRLKASWRKEIARPERRVLVSVASIWEISIKSATDTLQLDLPADLGLSDLAEACGFEDVPISARHAAAVRELPAHHADPFDRILIAQARLESLTIVTADEQVRRYDVKHLGSRPGPAYDQIAVPTWYTSRAAP
ncbi:MAG: type II toxin-antitoxin system VapC family toxin [Myxococcales bacterium]|nr:type II toxin-antitoxin system VapC family toxin [Myxococcales bacterium]